MAGCQDLVVKQGAAFTPWFQWRTGKTIQNSTPVDLSGYTGRMTARLQDGTIIFDLTTENGGITILAETGEIRLYYSKAAVLDLIPWDIAEYDLFVYDAGGRPFWISGGSLIYLPGQVYDDV